MAARVIARRDLVVGAACLAAAGASYAAKPRKELRLLPANETLEGLLPMEFAGWIGQDVGDPLALNQTNSLSARLYNQLVTRVYTETATGAGVMALLAYGAKQNDDLQLHRPEVCYPAFGYTLQGNRPASLQLAKNVTLPGRRIVAKSAEAVEYVTYWSRLGEFFPQSGGEQREARFLNAFRGVVPDGVLCRFSIRGVDEETAWLTVDALVRGLVQATPPGGRKVLIGSERASVLEA